MGARGGKRTGAGRKVGPNKATIEKAIIAERVMNEAAMSGRKLGKEVIEEFMIMFGGLAGMFQPRSLKEKKEDEPPPPLTPADIEAWAKSYKEPLFEKYSKLVLKAATELADFQSPRLAHVQTAAPAPERGAVKKKFTIGIFDNQGRKAPRHIDVKPNSSVTAPQKLN